MKDLNVVVDAFEVTHSQTFPKSGGHYQGNPWNFFEGFDRYRTDVREVSVAHEIEAKLEQLKEDAEALPWEN